LVLQKVPIPVPGPGQILVKVDACGVCHGDMVAKMNILGGGFPRVPGHEIAGRVAKLGPGVNLFKEGELIGVGWFGGGCGGCNYCRSGRRVCCSKGGVATGSTVDGGYAEYCLANADACARIPEGTDQAKVSPLMCAGITVFNALRHSKASPGDVVAVYGVGGLGHLGIQYANKMGYQTVAISRDHTKKELAFALGAKHYIATATEDIATSLEKLGGAKVVLYTATSGQGLEPLVKGLAAEGEIIMVAALHEPIPIDSTILLHKRASIRGWSSGDNKDVEDTIHFSNLTGVNAKVEIYPFSKVNEGFARMLSADAQFRVVLQGGWEDAN